MASTTAPGRSDRAVVRASGSAVGDLATRIVEPAMQGRGVANAAVWIDDRRCPAIVMRAIAPASYTGEDTLEVILPGNPHLVERFIEACCRADGVRRAGPGEFSARAYLNGRLALDEAEGVAAVIAARSREDLEGAQRLASGELGSVYRNWADELTSLLALVEAGIDFVDQEDVVPIRPRDLQERLERVRSAMAARSRGWLAESSGAAEPLVALVGPPNAGKSTLFNALLGRERSVVADEVGTTRDTLIESLRLDDVVGVGHTVRLADMPGLDSAATGAVNRSAQESAVETFRRADALIYCDPMGRFAQLPYQSDATAPILRVRTKADLLVGSGEAASRAEYMLSDVEVCALDGWHLDVLRRGIVDITGRGARGSCAVAFARHGREIARAVETLGRVAREIEPDAAALESSELLADGLRFAIDSLEQILGRVTPDDVIGRVFATFCVGK